VVDELLGVHFLALHFANTQIYGMYGCGAFMLNIFEKRNKNHKKRGKQIML